MHRLLYPGHVFELGESQGQEQLADGRGGCRQEPGASGGERRVEGRGPWMAAMSWCGSEDGSIHSERLSP